MQELQAELILKVDQADKKLDKLLNRFENKAENTGRNAGNLLGKGLAAAASSISSIGFANIFSNLTRGFVGLSQRAIQANNSQLQLSGAVTVANTRLTRQRDILTDVNASYEEKAAALGLDTDKIYENAKATSSSTNAYEAQEEAIERKQRALDAETNSLRQSIALKERDRDLAIQNLLRERGFESLADKRTRQESEILKLQNEKTRAELSGNVQQAFFIDEQIKLREKNLQLTENEIKQIQLQADTIRRDAEPAITSLQNKLNDPKRNKVQLEINEAKQKIQDLQDSISKAFSGGAAAQKISQTAKDFIDAQAEAIGKEAKNKGLINDADVDIALDRLEKKFGSRLTRGQLIKPLGDLLFEGVELTDAERLVSEFVDAASSGRSAGVSLGQAVENLGFAFRTANSQLGNLSGIPENFEDIDKNGRTALRNIALEQGRVNDAERIRQGLLTKSETLDARRLGILQATEDTSGAFERVQDPLAELDRQIIELQTQLGQGLLPILTDFIKLITPLLDTVVSFVSENKQLVATFGIAAVVITGLLSVLSSLAAVFFTLSTVAAALGTTIGVVIGVISGVGLVIATVVAAVTALTVTWKNNFFGIRTITETVFSFVSDFITDKFNEIVIFFSNIPLRIKEAIQSSKGFILDVFENIWSSIQKIFSNDIIRDLVNLYLIDPLNLVLNNIPDAVINAIPGLNGQIKGLLQDGIPRLANGGMLSGSNRLALLNDGKGKMAGQEMVINAPATSMFSPLLAAMNEMGKNGSTSINNSRTVNINNFGGGAMGLQYQTMRVF